MLPVLTSTAESATATMTGVVLASTSGYQPMPVSHAEVVIGGGYAKAYTDKNGRYVIEGLAPGVYAGIVRKDRL